MDSITFESVKKILLANGWYYYPLYDNWATGNTFGHAVISNSCLLIFLSSVTSICHLFTTILNQPGLCSPILSVLPEKFFKETEFEICA